MTAKKSPKTGTVRAGIGGWTYEPWRDNFYPSDLTQKRELEYASRQVTAIEINGTFYRTQTPASYRSWFDQTPDDFVFSLKAVRYAVNRKNLAEGKASVEAFLGSGIDELKHKLGPILWQLAPTKKFDPDELAGFLELLPKDYRHALEPRHESFADERVAKMLKKAGVALVFADSEKYPAFDDAGAPFVYARLQNARAEEKTGYTAAELKRWHKRFAPAAAEGRDVFVFFINGAKERAPAGAMAFLKLLG
jgi:uncharacterized protein YecE (DUF72 family)